ncbi:hypothetical protein C0992_010135 [Termitomyces sp. T32_za158]|nr:hypothetical protein C0992_010135 [Termitomyces sp. T32_za158]
MPISNATVLHVTRDAFEIAGSIVPFVGAAAVVVREITDLCDEIRVHKSKARRMANKCLQLQGILDEQNPDQGVRDNQEQDATHLADSLGASNGREVQLDIEKCEHDLDQQIQIFQLK